MLVYPVALGVPLTPGTKQATLTLWWMATRAGLRSGLPGLRDLKAQMEESTSSNHHSQLLRPIL